MIPWRARARRARRLGPRSCRSSCSSAGPPHRLTGLLFTPAIPTPLPPESIADVEAAWPPLAERASLLVAQVVNGECRPVAAVDPERVGPVGSTAKLYVLGAVATAILDGDLTWDQPVPIRDELKSHPSGTFHELPAGTERTVLEHATAMISQSDNTATDHLVDLVGREAVEAAMVEMGHAAPERNQPFLTTREMFLMKLDGVGEPAAYVDEDTTTAGPARRVDRPALPTSNGSRRRPCSSTRSVSAAGRSLPGDGRLGELPSGPDSPPPTPHRRRGGRRRRCLRVQRFRARHVNSRSASTTATSGRRRLAGRPAHRAALGGAARLARRCGRAALVQRPRCDGRHMVVDHRLETRGAPHTDLGVGCVCGA